MASEHETELDIIEELARIDDDASDDAAGEEESEGDVFETTWVAPTVLHIHSIVDADTVERVNRYLQKHPRVWQAVETGGDEEEEEEDDDDDDDDDDDSAADPKSVSRTCYMARDNARMARFYDELQPVVQASVQQFIERFVHFDIITSFDDYGCLEFRSGSFRTEAPEKTSLTSRDEGAIRTLVAIVLLADTTGDIEMPMQLTADGQPLMLSGRAGDIFVWPACPLHPYALKARERDVPLRYIQVNIA